MLLYISTPISKKVNDTMKQIFYAHNNENERSARYVTRSSAIFYFKSGKKVKTELHYLNYWLIKRGLTDVRRRVTFRDMAGIVLLTLNDYVKSSGAQKVDVNSLLGQNHINAEDGSIEVEFFSESNLFIAYPAVVVRYVGDNWHTFAHSSQRILSPESGDDGSLESGISNEGNITIQAGKNVRPFVIIHNGPNALDQKPIAFTVTSHDGECLSFNTNAVSWDPYQTRLIYLDHFINLENFLQGKFGTFNLIFQTSGVFPRLIGGCEKNGAWSIDHTNFSDVTGIAASDVIPVSATNPDKSLVFNLPNNVDKNWKCFADIYPTFPKDETYEVQISSISNKDRREVLGIEKFERKGSRSFKRIVYQNSDIRKNNTVELAFKNAQYLPRRFHVGIHYQVGDGLPGFLTDGPLPYTTPGIRTRWFPVFEIDKCENYLMMAHRALGDEDVCDIEFDVELYNSFGDAALTNEIKLKKYSQICLPIEEIFQEAKKYLKNQPGWIYMISSEKQRSVVHYDSKFGENSIGVCHAF